MNEIPKELGLDLTLLLPEQDPSLPRIKRKENELEPETYIAGLHYNRSLPEGGLYEESLIIEQSVEVSQKARILKLKRRLHNDYCSDNLYAVSIKEDMVYLCPKLHSASMKKRSIRHIKKKAIRRIGLQEMEDRDMTMEEYVQYENEKALRNGKVYNWETAMYDKICYDEDVHYLRFFKTEFPAIFYNDALESKSDFSSERLVSIRLIIEQRVEVNQKARILELKQRNYNDYYSDNLYAVSIKEDTTYLCPKLHSASMKERSTRSIQKNAYAVLDYKSWNILEYNNHGPHAKKPTQSFLSCHGGVLAESSQSSESSIGRHIKKPIWYMDNGCSRSMTGVKSYLHKYVEQPGPKVVFGDNSSCKTEGHGFINRDGVVFYRAAFFNGDGLVSVFVSLTKGIRTWETTLAGKPIEYSFTYGYEEIGDEVYLAFGGNTHDLGSFGEETDKTMNQHQDSSRFKVSETGDGVTIYTRRRHTSSSDGVTTSLDGVSPQRLNLDLEYSTL
ncbi:hypothetical protein Tco_0162702 [Tanacetum coccineum]